jgi:hypothetical protein
MEALKRASEKYRFCPPSATCESFPCSHSSFSTDEDYLLDVQDLFESPELHFKVWSYFRNRENLSPDVLTKYSVKLDRCQRISDKGQQISEENRANMEMYWEERTGIRREKVSYTEEEREAIHKANVQEWELLMVRTDKGREE